MSRRMKRIGLLPEICAVALAIGVAVFSGSFLFGIQTVKASGMVKGPESIGYFFTTWSFDDPGALVDTSDLEYGDINLDDYYQQLEISYTPSYIDESTMSVATYDKYQMKDIAGLDFDSGTVIWSDWIVHEESGSITGNYTYNPETMTLQLDYTTENYSGSLVMQLLDEAHMSVVVDGRTTTATRTGEAPVVAAPVEEEEIEEEPEEAEETEETEDISEESVEGDSEEEDLVADMLDEERGFLADLAANLLGLKTGDEAHRTEKEAAALASVGAVLALILGCGGGATGGTAGGAVGGVVGGSAGAISGVGENLGSWIKMDADGDLNFRDPATGEEKLYVSNKDGTYTNPLTNSTYTADELKQIAESREENAANIRADYEATRVFNEQQRNENAGLSREAVEWKQEKEDLEKRFAKEDRRNQLFYKKGVYDGDYKEYKKRWIRERMEEAKISADAGIRGDYCNAAAETAESTKKVCDVAIDVCAELEPTGAGKAIKNGYKALSTLTGNLGETMAGNQTLGESLVKTTYQVGIEYVKDNAGDLLGGSKVGEVYKEMGKTGEFGVNLTTNMLGDGTKEFLDALADGKDLNEAINHAKDGMKSGGLNALIDTGTGMLGDVPLGGASTKLFEKIADGSSKLVEGTMSSEAVRTGFQTFVADIIKDKAAAE